MSQNRGEGLDMNVQKAWQMGYTGQGVVSDDAEGEGGFWKSQKSAIEFPRKDELYWILSRGRWWRFWMTA